MTRPYELATGDSADIWNCLDVNPDAPGTVTSLKRYICTFLSAENLDGSAQTGKITARIYETDTLMEMQETTTPTADPGLPGTDKTPYCSIVVDVAADGK